ncbi:MAG: gliding motility-associated ABC transporter substrate-binding protein GldG [Bacteroidales bacterium]|nr:gliding motility-associated ABC transporter substrate-binding protein GldG [Bacteroidales bacterium]
MVKDKGNTEGLQMKRNHQKNLLWMILILIVVNWLGSMYYTRIDLTADKRFTLSKATKNILDNLHHEVYFKVYLDGDFPAGFKRLERQTREMLEEFRARNHDVHFIFINPSGSSDPKKRSELYQELVSDGLNPTNLQVKTKEGLQQQYIFPGAIVNYQDKAVVAGLLESQVDVPPEEVLNHSAENLEFTLVNTILKLVERKKPNIAFLKGQGELEGNQIADIKNTLSSDYDLSDVTLGNPGDNDLLEKTDDSIHPKYNVLIVAKPSEPFTHNNKLALDQYVMYGGKVLWLIDPVLASMDSIRNSESTVSIDLHLGLQELLFNYGVRLNKNLVLDMNATSIAVKTGEMGNQPQISLLPWYYFPLITPTSKNPIVKNLNSVQMQFVSTLDTLGIKGVKKTILLKTSPYVGIESIPGIISLNILKQKPDPYFFHGPAQAVAVLLDGVFSSDFQNMLVPSLKNGKFPFKELSRLTSMIVISDGDVIKNQLQIPNGAPLPLGYDQYSGITYGNKQLILNALTYLTEGPELLSLRSREVKLRLLDKTKINQDKLKWQLFNVFVPLIILALMVAIFSIVRKKKYGRSKST